MDNDRLLLDQITFLAGLTSSIAEVDPILETVRVITAGKRRAGPLVLNAEERKALLEVRAQLEDHLVTKDALRKFTKDSLQHTLNEQFQPATAGHDSPLQRVRKQFRTILVVIGGVFATSAALLLALGVPYWWLLAASCTVTAMFISSCWLFLAEYGTFSPALRKAYAWICAGVVLLGISASLWMLFTSIHSVFEVPILHYGLNYFLFDAAFFAAYMGVRFFALAQQVRTPLASVWWLVVGSLLLGFIATILPHRSTAEDRYLDPTMVGVALITFYGYVIALLADHVRHTLTNAYARAIGWFGAGYALSATVGIASTLLLLFNGTGFGIKLIIMGMFYATGGVLVFISGYLFRLSSAGQTEVLPRK
ncbi:MAG TPA: hypothetical protein VLF91_05475 [Candidatus Saccharimonadales bacterium]|nr:hypothetical protein [Candidatus Saccharimonadales bacterium]